MKIQEKLEKIPYVEPAKIHQDIDANLSTVKEEYEYFLQKFQISFQLVTKV